MVGRGGGFTLVTASHKEERFRFDSENIDSKLHQRELRKKRLDTPQKVNGEYKNFCSETCRNKYIRANHILNGGIAMFKNDFGP